MEGIERTELANQEYRSRVEPSVDGRDVCVHGPRVTPDTQPDINEPFAVSMTRYIMQSIIAESPYKPDMEWSVFHRCRELEDVNALPDGVTAEDIMQAYYRVFGGND